MGAVFANTVLPIEAHFGMVLALSLLILAAGFHFLVNDEQARAEEEDVPKFSFRTIDPVLFLLGLMGFRECSVRGQSTTGVVCISLLW